MLQVVQRPFVSFGANIFKRLPSHVHQLFVDVGVCHYMTIFKTPSGQLVQFDFGPRGGGDISLGPADRGRMARLFRKNRSKVVPAEIREDKVHLAPINSAMMHLYYRGQPANSSVPYGCIEGSLRVYTAIFNITWQHIVSLLLRLH